MGAIRIARPPATRSPLPPERSRRAAWLPAALITGLLLAFYVLPLVVHRYRLPVGPDAPYYVWSTKVAALLGLSATGIRPGLHALLLQLSQVTPGGVLGGVGATAIALAVALGLATVALCERAFGRAPLRSAAAGVVVGAYASRLAAGYLANLLFAAVFVAALVSLLPEGRRRPPFAAVVALLAAAGLAHMLVLAFGAAVLLGTIGLRLVMRGDGPARSEAFRVGAATLAGAAVAGLAFWGTRVGPTLPPVFQSRDALLRAIGLGGELHAAYLSRWWEAASSFLLPLAVPLAIVGAVALVRRGGDPAAPGRPLAASFLLAWAALAAAALIVGLATAALPAARVLSFAFPLPILATLGAVEVASRLTGGVLVPAGRARAKARARVASATLLGLLAGALVAAAAWSWWGQHPFTSRTDLQTVGATGRFAERLPAGTPLVFAVDHRGPHAGAEIGRYENVIRAGVPADRVPDVHLFVGSPADLLARRATLTGDAEHDGLAALYLRASRPELRKPHATFLVYAFNKEGWTENVGISLANGVRVLETPSRAATLAAATGDLPPVPPPGVAPALLLGGACTALVVLLFVGLGWARATLGRGTTVVLPIAPAFGAAALVLAGVAADLLGIRLTTGPAVAATVGAGLAGYAVWWRALRADRGDVTVPATGTG